MPNRAWLAVVAAGLIATSVLGHAQQETDSGEQRSDTQEDPTNNQDPAFLLPLPVPVEIIEDSATAQARERREAESSQREIDDLAAQQGMKAGTDVMAKATEDMRDYAYTQTWLVGLGTFLLFVTLGLTAWANWAAWRAVSVTREIGHAELRPWLHVDNVKILSLLISDSACDSEFSNSLWVNGSFEVINSGATPALHASVWQIADNTHIGSGHKKLAPLKLSMREKSAKGGGDSIPPHSYVTNEFTLLIDFNKPGIDVRGTISLGLAFLACYQSKFERDILITSQAFMVFQRQAPGLTTPSALDYEDIINQRPINYIITRVGISEMT